MREILLKGAATFKASDLKCKPLLSHAICRKLDQNLMKNKNVTDVCIVETSIELKIMESSNFRLCDVTQPQVNMNKQNN